MVIYDKLDAPAPIGSGLILQPVGLHVLDTLSVGEQMRALGAPIARLFGKSGRNIVLDVRYRALGANAPLGLAVHRGALFAVLYQAAQHAGAAFEPRRDVIGVDDGVLRFANGARTARFDLVVDALGMRSPLSRAPVQNLAYGALWASLEWRGPFDKHTLEQRYEAARKMAGVLPIGRLPGSQAEQAAFFWSLRHDARAAWEARGLEAWRHDVRALWPDAEPLLAQIERREQLVFAAYAHRTLASPVARGLAHIGDSWHCTSPQLGQGANMALLDALALAHALERQHDIATALGEYARMRLWHIRLYQAASWLFTPAYQSDSAALAWLRDRIVAPISRLAPGPQMLAALVAGQVGWPLSAMGAGLQQPRDEPVESKREQRRA